MTDAGPEAAPAARMASGAPPRARLALVFLLGLAVGGAAAVALAGPVLDRWLQAALPLEPQPTVADAGSTAGEGSRAAPATAPSAERSAATEGWEPAGGFAQPAAQQEEAALQAALDPGLLAEPVVEATPDAPAPGRPLIGPDPADADAAPAALPPAPERPDAPPAIPAAASPAPEAPVPAGIAPPPPAEPRLPDPGDSETVLARLEDAARAAASAGMTAEASPAEEVGLLAPEAIIRAAAPPPSRPAPAVEPERTAAPDPAAIVPPADAPAGQAPRRILVHVPTAAPGSDVENALAGLAAAGLEPDSRISVNLGIGSTNVRYYFAEDAALAAAAARAIRSATGQPAEARDFTDFRPRPAPGTVEIWLAGQPRPSAAPAQAAAAPPQPPAQAQPARGGPPPQAAQPPGQAARGSGPGQQAGPPPGQARPPAGGRQPAPPREAHDPMRELERLADEIARAIARSLRN